MTSDEARSRMGFTSCFVNAFTSCVHAYKPVDVVRVGGQEALRDRITELKYDHATVFLEWYTYRVRRRENPVGIEVTSVAIFVSHE